MKDEAQIKDSIARKRIAELKLVIQNAQAEIDEAERDIIPTTEEVLSELSPVERQVIESIYGVDTPKVIQKVAAKQAGLSMYHFRNKLYSAECRIRRVFGQYVDIAKLLGVR